MKNSPRTSRTETLTDLTLFETLDQGVQTFGSGDSVCVTGDAYCPLSDLAAWMSTPPAAQSIVRRHVALSGRVIEQATGCLASHNIVVGMIPHTTMWKGETARGKSTKPRFLFAIDSLRFMQTLRHGARCGVCAPSRSTMRTWLQCSVPAQPNRKGHTDKCAALFSCRPRIIFSLLFLVYPHE